MENFTHVFQVRFLRAFRQGFKNMFMCERPFVITNLFLVIPNCFSQIQNECNITYFYDNLTKEKLNVKSTQKVKKRLLDIHILKHNQVHFSNDEFVLH